MEREEERDREREGQKSRGRMHNAYALVVGGQRIPLPPPHPPPMAAIVPYSSSCRVARGGAGASCTLRAAYRVCLKDCSTGFGGL